MYSIVASRYARALADIAFDPKSQADAGRIAEEVGSFAEAFNSSPELRTVLLSPAVKLAKKRDIASKLGERLGLSKITKNFLNVVIAHGRVGEIKGIHEALVEAIDTRSGVVRADVSSAADLSPAERQAFEDQLNGMTGKRVRAIFTTDPDLLGGATVKIGSQIYDGSVRGKLRALGARLTAAV